MKAGNKEELMQKLKIWHDENTDTYIKFKESVRKAHNDDMGFFNDNVNMLGFDVQEEIDQSESADIEFFMASQLLEKTKAHSQEYAEKIVQNAFNDDPHTLCMLYFMLFENGGIEMAEILAKNSKKFTSTPDTDLRNMYDGMINASVKNGVQTKGDWKMFAKETFMDGAKKLINSVLVTVKGFTGKRSQNRLLKDLLIDADEHLLERIKYHIERRPTDAYLACIMRALELSGHLSKCTYAEFFRSLVLEFPDKNIKSANRGQELYHALVQYRDENHSSAYYLDISSNNIVKGDIISKKLAKEFL